MFIQICSKRICQFFLKQGQIKIGHLAEYRNIEKYSDDQGMLDKNEGRVATNLPIEGMKEYNSKDIKDHRMLNKLFKNVGTSKITLGNLTISEQTDNTDFLICCFSSRFSPELFKDFNADVCFKIRSPAKLFEYLNRTVAKKGIKNPGVFNQCIYNDRQQEYDETKEIHAVFCKEKRFEHQKEWRIGWENPKGQDSFIINCPI